MKTINIEGKQECHDVIINDTIADKEIFDYTFKNIHFYNATFKNVIFTNVRFIGDTFINCTFKNVSFQHCTIDYSHFSLCTFMDSSFFHCDGFTIIVNKNNTIHDLSVYWCLFNSVSFYALLEKKFLIGQSLIIGLDFDPQVDPANIGSIYLKSCSLPGLIVKNKIPDNLFIFADERTSNVQLQCPEEGSFIGFKCAENETIVKLLIPEDALRSSSSSRKCRCSKAKVLSIENADGTPYESNSVASIYYPSFIYTIGETVEVPDFDKNRWTECAKGIHFFITKEEAIQYSRGV